MNFQGFLRILGTKSEIENSNFEINDLCLILEHLRNP
jgi:hypothetical protein